MAKEEIGEFLYKIHQSIVDLVEKTDRMSAEIRAIGCENAKLKKELEEVRDRMAEKDEILRNVQDKLENMNSDPNSDVKVFLHPPHSDNDSEKSFNDEFLGGNKDLSWKKLGPQGPYLLSFDKSDDEKSDERFGHCITKRMLSTQFETPDDSDVEEIPRRNKKSESEAEMKILNKKLLLKNDIRRQSAPTLSLRKRDTSPVNINHGLTKKNENKNLLAHRLGIEEDLERVKMKLSETDLTKIPHRLSVIRKDDSRRQSSPDLSTEGSNILSVRRKTTEAKKEHVEERRKSINLSMHGVNDYKPEREDVFTNLAFKFGIGNELLNAQRKLSEPNLIENHYKGTSNNLTVPESNRRNSTDLSMISTRSNFLTLRQKFLDDIAEKNRERFTSEPNLIANIRGISNRKQLTVPEINRRKSTDLSDYTPPKAAEVERKLSDPVLHTEEKPKRKRKLSKNIAHQIASFIKGGEKKKSEKFKRSSVSSMPGSMRKKTRNSLKKVADKLGIDLHLDEVQSFPLDTDGESGSRESLVERKMQPSPPIKTTTYKVEATDTLTSVAARFDTTPSELAKLNKLVSRTVFPGQVIRVPDNSAKKLREGDEDGDGTSQTASIERSENTDEEDMLDTLRVNSPKPGHIERIGTPSSPHLEKFLRINVRHITDGQGVVSGTLIVTPNALMFDPNVSDPLVIERGPEAYGVIAPMDYVVNAAIYNDIAHMRVGHEENKKLPKPEVYHMKSEESEGEGDASCLLSTDQGDSRDLSAKETLADLRSSTEEEDGWYGGAQREGDAFPKAFERDLVTPTNSTIDKLSDNQDTTAEDKSPLEDDRGDAEALVKATEERRRSCLDHHWAVPKHSIDNSLEREESVQEAEGGQEPVLVDEGRRGSEGHLVKLSCHDSGIDIRDPPPSVPILPKKTVYSDADILLAGDGEFLPPKPVKPLEPTISEEEKKKQSVSFSIEEEVKKDEDKQEPKKSKMLKRLSYPLSWVEGFTGSEDKDSLPSSADSHPSHTPSSVFSISKVFSSSPINMVTDFGSGLFMKTPSEDGNKFQFPPNPLDSQPGSNTSSAPSSAPTFSPSNIISAAGRSSVGTYIKPKLDYRSMVSVDDMPELFVSFDKLIPRPARSCEDPPLYLRLRMGKPKGKKIPRSSAIMSYGKKRMRPEYWFSVPREKVDELYKFLTTFAGHLYGDLDEEEVAARGYEFVDSDTELFDEEEGNGNGRRASEDGDLANLTKESWEVLKARYAKFSTLVKTQATFPSTDSQADNEVLSMSGELRRALYASSVASLDLELFLPDLNGQTEILSEDHRKQLCRHLPARAEGYVWTLVFSTSTHGFSLNSMYRKMTRLESPILMVIQDTDNNVFGALTSCSFKVSDHFYGTGESLLFRFHPDIQVYNWTGENMFFIKGNNESLSIGAGDGKFGLWLDGDLNQGRSEPCATYGNEPLSPQQDFVVKTIECWAFF